MLTSMGSVKKTPARACVRGTVPTTKTPWTFAAMDLREYGLILGTGGNAFMNVQWVHDWQ